MNKDAVDMLNLVAICLLLSSFISTGTCGSTTLETTLLETTKAINTDYVTSQSTSSSTTENSNTDNISQAESQSTILFETSAVFNDTALADNSSTTDEGAFIISTVPTAVSEPEAETSVSTTTSPATVSPTTSQPTTTLPPGKYPATDTPNWENVDNYVLSFTFKCNTTFNDELANDTSDLYNEYKLATLSVVTDAFSEFVTMEGVLVNGFSKGSVISNYSVIMAAQSVIGRQMELFTYISEHIVDRLGNSSLIVQNDSISIDSDHLLQNMREELHKQNDSLFANPCYSSRKICSDCYACSFENLILVCNSVCNCRPGYHGAECDVHENLIIGVAIGFVGVASIFVFNVIVVVSFIKRHKKRSGASCSYNEDIALDGRYDNLAVIDNTTIDHDRCEKREISTSTRHQAAATSII